jgi:tRNA(Ser,Leu) C12 N-acetylase TAN1
MSSAAGPAAKNNSRSRFGWNVTVTFSEPTFGTSRRLLRRWGDLHPTGFFNVAVMAVPNAGAFLDAFAAAVNETPGILNAFSHLVAFEHVFDFKDAAEFEATAREIALSYAPRLAGKTFHVRLRRRGLKGELSTPGEERFLDDSLLAALEAAGKPGKISFEDPDYVLLVETVGNRGGMALWSREDLRRYRFLGAA